ncbi:hypothetical protein BH11MYX4_BH11MYX4_47720 [soil metagenome]
MVPTTKPQALLVRLLDGQSEQRELVFESGCSMPPLSLGSAGPSEWRIDAGRVAAVHVLLAFNGADLYVCAVRGEQALLDGAQLGKLWTVASIPSELRFGGARLSISVPVAEVQTVSPLAASVRGSRIAEEKTSIDAHRLAEALRLSMLDAPMPPVARRPPLTAPLPPRRRPAIRAIDATAQLLRGLHPRAE